MMSKLSFMGAIAKGAFHPAAYVALGNLLNITSNVKGFEISDKLAKLGQGLTLANGREVLEGFTQSVRELDLSSAEIPMKFFREHSFEMGTAAFWGVTSTLANRILQDTPGFRNYPKARVFVAGMIGAGTTWATWHFGLNRTLDVQACTDLALKLGIIGGVWKIATTNIRCLRFFDWGGLPEVPKKKREVPKKPLPEVPKKALEIRPNAVEQINGHFLSGMMNVILRHVDTVGLFREPGSVYVVNELYGSPTEKNIQAAARLDIKTITSTLKKYLKEMKPHLLDKIKDTLLKMNVDKLDAGTLKGEIATLDDLDKALLKKLMECLSKIAANAAKNQMTAENLSICMAPNLFEPHEDIVESVMETGHMNSIVAFMIENYLKIFE